MSIGETCSWLPSVKHKHQKSLPSNRAHPQAFVQRDALTHSASVVNFAMNGTHGGALLSCHLYFEVKYDACFLSLCVYHMPREIDRGEYNNLRRLRDTLLSVHSYLKLLFNVCKMCTNNSLD